MSSIEFTDYSEGMLEHVLRALTDAAESSVTFTVRFANLPADCTLVEFMPGKAVKFHVPSQFPSAERLNFYTNRWLFTWQMFASVKERYTGVTGSCPLWLDDFPGGSGLAFCGNTVSHVLVPDCSFLQSCGYAALRMRLAEEWVAWDSRVDKIFWRGASTGNRGLLRVQRWQDIPRFRLCLLAKDLDRHEIFDVGISTTVQIWDAGELDEIAHAGLHKEGVPPTKFLSYRYALDIDGNTCSWPGLFTKLLMGNAVLKVDSMNGFRQWYYRRLIPWKNFVPITSDMSELIEVAQWLRRHPKEAMEIATAGRELADSLTMDRALEDTADVIVDSMSYWPPPAALPLATVAEKPAEPTAPATTRMPTMSEITEPNITQIETSSGGDLVQKVKSAFNRAWLGDSNIDPAVLQISGMSGRKYRKFINNLVHSIYDATYLEVGSWMGSTLCSAINRNRVRATAIDNWSEFGGPKNIFLENLDKFRTPDAEVNIIEDDFRKINFASLGTYDVYLFDGPHQFQDQYDGIGLAQAALKQRFVLVIDDWNWEAVRTGTLTSLQAFEMSVLYSMEIRTTLDNSHPGVAFAESDWHNGYLIAVIERTKS